MQALKAVLSGCVLGCAMWASQAVAAQQVINFEVSASSEVANDEVYATLTKTVRAKDAKTIADTLNPVINKALQISKKYPNVTVSTGRQSAYPNHDSDGVMRGMVASASLQLKSQDVDSISALIAELQPLLVIENINFGVSQALKEQTQARLMVEATNKFKQQANAIAQAWGANSYQLVNAQMNTQGGYGQHAEYVLAAPMAADSIATKQVLQAGRSDISYTINGMIELK